MTARFARGIQNLAVNVQGRFWGKHTWGPRYAELETAGIVFLTFGFLSVSLFVLKQQDISNKKPLLFLMSLAALIAIAFFLLEIFG